MTMIICDINNNNNNRMNDIFELYSNIYSTLNIYIQRVVNISTRSALKRLMAVQIKKTTRRVTAATARVIEKQLF